ncbi:MAG: hypothetical protein MJZ98_00515 [Paludibacteraceae bacterium]|nr:hypothetical protein [Paludibacteraceae bacterium]
MEVIQEKMYEHYNVTSDYDKESGCYHNGRWFSINEVMNIIEEALDDC